MQALKEQIYTELAKFGIDEKIVIDDEAATLILQALQDPTVAEVTIEDDGTLVVEFNDEENI